MALFEWNDELTVGNDFIDNDHKKLVKLVNDSHNAMEEGRGNDVIGKVLNNLVNYTKQHFKREDDEMARIKYALSKTHQIEHDKLLKQVGDLQNDFNNGKMMLTIKVSKFLKDWLVTHIMQTDKLFAEAIRKAA